MKIVTENQIYGWIAVDDDTYDGPGSLIGVGNTEAEAIADLKEKLDERRVSVVVAPGTDRTVGQGE